MFQEYRANGFKKADYEYTRWSIRPPAGTPAEAVKIPEYWRNHNNLLKPGDILEVLAQDGSYDMELRVVATDRLWVKVRVLREWHADADESVLPITAPLTRPMGDMVSTPRQPTPAPPEAAVETDVIEGLALSWGGPNHRWRIIDENGDIVEKGFPTKDAASVARAAYIGKRAA